MALLRVLPYLPKKYCIVATRSQLNTSAVHRMRRKGHDTDKHVFAKRVKRISHLFDDNIPHKNWLLTPANQHYVIHITGMLNLLFTKTSSK